MSTANSDPNRLGGVPGALMNLINAEIALGSDLIRSLTGIDLPNPGDLVRVSRARLAPACRIPPPCWMPQPIGECVSFVGQCRSAGIRLVVTNCDRIKRTITIDRSTSQGNVTISPATLALGPMERETVSVNLDVPSDAADGTRFENLIWVRGCKTHFLRWTVFVGRAGIDSCHELTVNDCPDFLHHWYDHFYCVRGCSSGQNAADRG
jgi:hypothetical protein